jgi:L-ascorbate metabolism protein UlaG (beta-lactamase superfamily)
MESSSHFDGKRYYNPNGFQPRGWLDVLRWQWSSRRERSPRFVSDVEPHVPAKRVEGDELRVILVNHSTVLLQEREWNILTDPIWSMRASPFSWIGPRRRRNPGVRQEDLPAIDFVLLSHDHYDHLDLPTLGWLQARGDSLFIVPRGVGRLLQSAKIGPVHELDWGQKKMFGNATIHCVPAVHFAGRGFSDSNKTLWCGYVIESDNRVIYFAGDTAYGDHFHEIRKRFGPPRLSLLPVGAYAPRWFMSPVHMDPDEAVTAHEILGSRTSVAIHHGTFQLGDEAVDTPSHALMAIPCPESFLILRNGESATIR